MSNIPPITDKRWEMLVKGQLNINFDFFPLKLLLARLQLEMKMESSVNNTERCVTELRLLFLKNRLIPNAQNDLNKIFGGKKVSRWRRILRRQ